MNNWMEDEEGDVRRGNGRRCWQATRNNVPKNGVVTDHNGTARK